MCPDSLSVEFRLGRDGIAYEHWGRLIKLVKSGKVDGVECDGVPDVTICTVGEVQNCPGSVIILEAEDGPRITASREVIAQERVLAVVKGNVFRAKSFYNLSTVGGRYHGYLCHNEMKPKPNAEMRGGQAWSEHDLSKIRALYTYAADRGEYVDDLDAERPLSASFAGTTVYRHLNGQQCYWLDWHRRCAVDELSKVKWSKCYDRLIPYKDYLSLLAKSQVCVSPWGWGEVCIRDFEAIKAGCVVVKPNTSHITTYPDIYKNNERCVTCAIDFSDLPEVVSGIVDNWGSYRKIREDNQSYLRSAMSDGVIAKRISDFFARVQTG